MSTIRGHMGTFKVFQDGQLQNIINVTNVDVNQDSSFSRSFYVGNPVPVGDQSIEGWSGTCELEVSDAGVDTFIDQLIAANQNGIGVPDYTFQTTENYANGTTKSYVYFDVQWKMGRRQGGLQEKVTKRLEFQASGRVAL